MDGHEKKKNKRIANGFLDCFRLLREKLTGNTPATRK